MLWTCGIFMVRILNSNHFIIGVLSYYTIISTFIMLTIFMNKFHIIKVFLRTRLGQYSCLFFLIYISYVWMYTSAINTLISHRAAIISAKNLNRKKLPAEDRGRVFTFLGGRFVSKGDATSTVIKIYLFQDCYFQCYYWIWIAWTF